MIRVARKVLVAAGMRTLGFVVMLLSIVSIMTAGCRDVGGCSLVYASAVTTSPAQSCLTLTITEAENPSAYNAACSTITLTGKNNCTETLTLPAANAAAGAALTVAPGATITYGVALEKETNMGDKATYLIPATLGTDSVEIQFVTSATQ